jgi:hypothetical protein
MQQDHRPSADGADLFDLRWACRSWRSTSRFLCCIFVSPFRVAKDQTSRNVIGPHAARFSPGAKR